MAVPNGSSVHERSPLLVRSQSALSTATQFSLRVRRWERANRIVNLFILVVLLTSLGDQLQESPQTRINEAVICYRYWELADPSKILLDRASIGPGAIGGVDELLCKTNAVQSDLVMLKGWQAFLDGVPSLVLAVPIGWAADRVGRKPLIMLGLLGFVLRLGWMQFATWFWQVFSIRWTWLSALFGSLGGGSGMTAALAFVILSDVTPEAGRGAVFLRVGAFNLLANLLMPPLAAWLMQYSPWIPALGGTGLAFLAIIVCAFLPETLHWTTSGVPPPPADQTLTTTSWYTTLTADPRLILILLPFIIHPLIASLTQIMVQYLSARFLLRFSKATLVATVRGAVLAGLLFTLLPLLAKFMRKYLSAQRTDLLLARTSHLLLAVGWIAFGLAPTVPLAATALAVASLGQGATFLLRSFLTSLLPRDRIAVVYSVISVVETLGIMLGSPTLAGMLKKGFEIGMLGLPFVFTGILAAVFGGVLMFVRAAKEESDSI